MRSSVRWGTLRSVGLAALGVLAASALSVTVPLGPAVASAAALPVPTITAPATGATSSTPTVTISGTATGGTAPTIAVVVTVTGHWLAQAKIVNGAWSVPVTLLERSTSPTTYSVAALEIDTKGDVGSASPPVAVTVTSNDVVVNGGFETPLIATVPNKGNWANLTSIPGWTPTNTCGIELQETATVGVTPYTGNQYVELASNCVSGIRQDLSTVPGLQYTLRFAYRARPNTTPAENTMSVQWTGTTVAPDLQGTTAGPTDGWTVATYVETATSTTTTLQFNDTYTANLSYSLGDFLDGVSVVPSFSLAPSNTRWQTASTLTTGSATSGAIGFSGEQLWWRFPIVPGEHVTAVLTAVPANYQVSLYSDITALYRSLTTPSSALDLTELAAQSPANTDQSAQFYDGQFYDGQFYDGQFYDGQFYDGQFYDGQFYDGHGFTATGNEALALSQLGVSTQQGTVNKTAAANSFNDTGYFYVEVSGIGGAFSQAPFTLTVTTAGNSCSGAPLTTYFASDGYSVTTSSAATISGAGTHYSTVIVADSQTMPQMSTTATLSSSLQSLASATNGVVVDVGRSTWVRQQTLQAQAFSQCPYDVNLEADAIQRIVNTYRTPASPSSLKYVVIVGDDDVIPFFRDPDQEQIQPESNYTVPLASTSEPQAALANNYFLTDDLYGATSSLSINGSTLPIQSAAVGRLVETPSDIEKTIAGYLSTGVISATSSLSAGYTFMARPASQVANAFSSAGIASTASTQLITAESAKPTTPSSWSASQLSAELTSKAHQLVFLGAHFNANALLAADRTTSLTTYAFSSEIGTKLANSLVLSAGCHAGYTIDPADATQYTDTLAWPQALAEAGASLVAGTGYQYGDSNYVAASDQLYVDLAQQLGDAPAGGGPAHVGTALLQAGWRYLASLDQLNGIDEKSLLETTLYGLPMLGVQLPTPQTAPGGSTSVVGTPQTVSSAPGSSLGLAETSLSVTPKYGDASTYQRITVTATGTPYTYLQGPQGVVADPGSPVVPVQTEDVNVTGSTLRGVGFWSGTYTDTAGGLPLTGDPVTQTAGPPPRFSSPVFYPEKLTNPNYFGTLDTGAGTELGITPVQYASSPSAPTQAIERTYSSMTFHLFYSSNTATYGGTVPALSTAPAIGGVAVTATGTTVTVSATVAPDPAAGVQQVWTTYTDPAAASPHWSSVDLTQSPTDPSLWTTTFSDPTALRNDFMVQAVNGVGEVGLDDNNGAYFTPVPANAAQTPPATYSLQLGGTTSAPYGSTATVTATLSKTSASGDVTGRPIAFSLGTLTVYGFTDSAGTASARIPLRTLGPGTYPLTAAFSGDATDAPASAGPEPFTLTRAQATLALSDPTGGVVTTGSANGLSATLTASTGAPLAQRTVSFDVTRTGETVGGSVATTGALGTAPSGALTLPAGDVGTGYEVTASFTTPDYAPASSAPLALAVSDRTTVALGAAPNPAELGATVALTATVDPVGTSTSTWLAGPDGASPTGTVSFADGSTALGTAPIELGGTGVATATLVAHGLPEGAQRLTASYPGSSYIAQSSGSTTETVETQQTFTSTISGLSSGSVTVGTGQSLLVTGTVTGSVTVEPGGTLEVLGGTVTGNITGKGAAGIALCGATVDGNVSAKGDPGYVFVGGETGCAATTISGNLTLKTNTGGFDITGSVLGGSLTAMENVSSPGQSEFPPVIAGNTMSGLTCKTNTPPPTDLGRPNVVTKTSGQCATL